MGLCVNERGRDGLVGTRRASRCYEALHYVQGKKNTDQSEERCLQSSHKGGQTILPVIWRFLGIAFK